MTEKRKHYLLLKAAKKLFTPSGPAPVPNSGSIRRLLLLRPDDRLGNVILTTPLARSLRQALPETEIDWLIPQRYAPLLSDNDESIRILPFEKRKLFTNPFAWYAFISSLRKACYDAVVDASHEHALSTTGMLLTQYCGAPIRIGHKRFRFDDGYTHAVERRGSDAHEITRKLRLSEPFAGEKADPWIGRINAEIEKDVEQWLREKNLSGKQWLLLWPGARKADRRWPLDRYAELLGSLPKEDKLPIVIGWGGREKEDALQLADTLGGIAMPEAGPRRLAIFCRKAAAYIGNDTGPLHLAHAVRTPTFSFIPGYSQLRWTYSDAPDHTVIIDRGDLASPETAAELSAWLKTLRVKG